MNKQDMAGVPVMVDSLLWNDPFGKKGQIGVLTRIDITADDFYVRFEDGMEGLYSANALLILKQPEEVRKILSSNYSSIQGALEINLFSLLSALEQGGDENTRRAMKIAQQDNGVAFYATSTLQYHLGIWPVKNMGR